MFVFSPKRAVFFVIVLLASLQLHTQTSSQAHVSVVDANNRFAFKLFNQLVTKTPDKNILVAPTGLSLTFGLLDNGSDPETRKETESVFEFTGMDLAQINDGFAALRKELNLVLPPPQKRMLKGGRPASAAGDPNLLIIADSIWGHEYFSAPFLKTSRDCYGVDLQRLLPSSTPSAQISRWASKQVHRNVSIGTDELARNAFFLVDVTRFHSLWDWGYDFHESMTEPAQFILPTGQKKKVQMMHQNRKFDYLEGPKFQAVVLPYRENASMYVFLPGEGSSLSELEQILTAKNWQEWLSQFRSREGFLGMPKFKIEMAFDARTPLQELGVNRIFEQFAALRPGVTVPEGARLTNALQRMEISVDEKKTEVISDSVPGGIPGGISVSRERPLPFVMSVNRPFFFAIRHNSTGQLLFMGAIVEP